MSEFIFVESHDAQSVAVIAGVQWVHDCGICWRYLMNSYDILPLWLQWYAMICNDMQWYAMICNDMQWYAIICNHLQSSAIICNHLQSYDQGVSRRQWIECHPLITVQVVLMLWNRDSLRMLRRRILWRRCQHDRTMSMSTACFFRNLVCSDLAAHFRYPLVN